MKSYFPSKIFNFRSASAFPLSDVFLLLIALHRSRNNLLNKVIKGDFDNARRHLRFKTTHHIPGMVLIIIHAANSLVTQNSILFAGTSRKSRVLAYFGRGAEICPVNTISQRTGIETRGANQNKGKSRSSVG